MSFARVAMCQGESYLDISGEVLMVRLDRVLAHNYVDKVNAAHDKAVRAAVDREVKEAVKTVTHDQTNNVRCHFEVFNREWPESGDIDVAIVRLLEDWRRLRDNEIITLMFRSPAGGKENEHAPKEK